MAADFQLVLGANYSQLERDLKIATDIALKWSDNARQQAIFNIQTKVNKQSLNASLAEMNKAIEKATSKVADENRIFNLFTTKKKLFSRQVDFREGIESTDQLIQRINELRNLLRGMDTGRIKVISGENAEEARQLSDQIDALQKRISVLKNGSSKKGIKEFENMSIKLNEAKKEANNLKVALDSLKNSGRHGKAFDREVRNLEDALQRANNKVKEFQANVRMLGKNNKTISDFDGLNKQLYEAESRMEALLEKSQKDTNAKQNIQSLIEIYRELFRIISQGERDMLRGINQIDKEEQKAARKAEQETSKITKKQKAALEDILKKKEQINNLRSNLTSKDDLDSLRVNRDIIQQIYNIQKSLIGKKSSGIDNTTLEKTKSELDEIISKINIAKKSSLNTFAMNKIGIISSYGDDETSLKRKRALWEQLRNEFIKYETQTGKSQSKNIAAIESEIDATKRLIDAKSGLNSFNKKNQNLTNQLYGAEQNGNIENQIQLLRQLRNLNLQYYGDTKDIKFRDNAKIYQQQLDALQQKTDLQKQDEENNKKILELEKQRDEVNRRLGMIPANTKNKQEMLEQIQLYRELARIEQKLYNKTNDIQHRNNADAFRAQARALAELNKQYVSNETIQRKLAGVKNLQGGIVANTMDPAQLNTNIKLLQRIISLQNDLQQSGRPQNIKQSMADLEMYKQKLREIRRENLGTNTSFMRQGGILQSLVSYARMYLSIWQGIRLVKSIAETTGEFEKQKAALKSIIQDGAIAVELFNKLKQYSLQTPLTFQELVSTTKKLTAYQIPVEDLFETTKRLSDLSSGLGVDINRIVLAYGQIRASSVLSGQEVRQLTEAGIPIINELARAFSNLEGRAVSTAEVFKKISERGVSFQMVKDILFDMTSEGGKFYNMQEKLMQTDIYGPMQKMKDLWKQTLDEIGRSSKDGILKKGLDAILTTINNWRTVLVSIAGLIAGKLTAGIANLVKWIWTLNRAKIISNMSNIFTAATTAIGLIIGKMIEANSNMKNFINSINEVNFEYNKKASELIESFKKLYEELNNTTQGSKAEEEALRKLQNAFSEYLPQQDLSIKRLRDQTKGYEDLTEAILHNVEAQRRVAIEQSAKDKMDNTIKSKLSKLKYQNAYNPNMPYGQQDLKPKLIPDNKDIFKNWFISYISTNIGKLDTETIKNNVLESYKSMYEKMFPDGTDYNDIAKSLSLYINDIEAIYKQYSGFLNESNDFYKIADSNGQYSQQIEDKVTEISNRLKEALANDNNTRIDIEKGQTLEMLNNASYFKYYNDMLNAMGLKTDSEGMYDKFKTGELKSYDIVSFIRSAMYKNGKDDKNGITEEFAGINTYYRNRISKIEKEATDRFPFLDNMQESINDFIKSNPGKELDTFLFNRETSFYDWREKLTKAFSNVQNKIDEFDTSNLNEQTSKSLEELENKKKLLIELGKLGSVKLETKEDKKNASQSTQNDIVSLKKEFDNLKNAYTSEQNMMKYVTESSAIETLRGMDKPGLSEYFTKTLGNGSIDWVSQFKEIYKKLSDIDTDAAISMQEDWNKFIAKDVVADKLRELKNGIEDIDRSFEKSKNAKEYFQALLDAGMSWEDAVLAATKISGTFDIAQKGSTLIQEQIGKLMSGIGINYDLTGDAGISAFEKELRKVTEMQIGENESVFGDSIPKEKAEEILKLLSQLREIQKNELVELVKINTDNYDIKGVGSERARLYSSFLESLESGSSAMILDSYGKLSANNARLFNPFNTGNDASFALSNLYELIKKGENVQENTSAFNKIAETLPGGNRVKEALATNDEKIIEDAIKKATAKLKLQEIAGKMDDMLSVFNSAVGLVDSFTLITGGQVNENDQFHTAMSSFTNIMSSGSSAVKKALTGDFLGAIADGAKAMSELVLFGAKIHDAGLQQEIDKLTEHIEKLDTAISNLERTASLSYGEEKWLYESNALRKMYVQLEDAKKASELENSKKIVDKDKRAELEQQVTDMELSIEEKWKEITDDIFGSVDDIASRLGNALRDAFENGKNAARAWKDAVNEYVKDIFYNLMIESVMKDKVDEIVQGWKAKSQTDTDTKNEEKRAELIQEEYQKYLDKVDKYSKEHEGNNQMIHRYAMEQYKEYQDKVDEINATSYYSEKDAFKDWVLKNTDKMAEDLNDIYNDPELQAYYKVWKSLHGSTTSSASSNSLQSMTEDAANRLQALWNTCLVEFIKGNGMLTNVESNTAGILNQIQITNQLIGSMSNLMNKNQTDILGALSSSASGAKPLYVKMS